MKKDLLLLHGALGSKVYFQPLLPQLNSEFNVYTFNFEGHGGVSSNKDFSIDLFVENTRDFLMTNELKQIDIFGYSMGGYVALKLANKHPELVHQIITLGTKFEWTVESAAQEVKMLNPDKIELKVPGFAAQLKERHVPIDWKENMLKTAQMMTRMGNGAIMSPAEFQEIKQHVSIGIGTNDKMVSIAESEHIANLLPNGTLNCLTGLPHPIDQIESEIIVEYIENELK